MTVPAGRAVDQSQFHRVQQVRECPLGEHPLREHPLSVKATVPAKLSNVRAATVNASKAELLYQQAFPHWQLPYGVSPDGHATGHIFDIRKAVFGQDVAGPWATMAV